MKKSISILLFMFLGAVNGVWAKQEFVIIDSWMCGFVGGIVHGKSIKSGWKEANKRAKNDCQIWGGLVVSDDHLSTFRRGVEVLSRFTYQAPQTIGGFTTAQLYNTFTRKVAFVQHASGATSVTMDVSWPGVCLGSYILGRKSLFADANNKLFQHEYGHYLQSKRMGFAYFIRVGLPAIMSKGDHDKHPVEVDCNREAFLYWNRQCQSFQSDSLLSDACGWNFDYNPFPDTIGHKVKSNYVIVQYVDFSDSLQRKQVESLKVKPKVMDYVSWIIPPVAFIVGVANARHYNKIQLEQEVNTTSTVTNP